MDDPRFAAAPSFGKVAIGGRWERAMVLQPSHVAPQEVRRYLGASQEVACEAFFGSAFFGVRMHGPDPARFVTAFADAMGAAASGADFFRAVAGLGVVPATDFRFAELGAEGAWNSVGALRIAAPCAALTDTDALWRRVTLSPVGRDRVHDKALEFSYAGGIPHWFALPVSESGLIARSMVEQALHTFCR